MKTQDTLVIVLLLIGQALFSQTTIVLQPGPEEGKDAFIHRRLPDAQHGDHFDFAAMAWTNSGIPNVIKSLIEFDLSEIPQGSTIISAGLTLCAHVSPLNGNHSKLSGSNEAELLVVTEPWQEDRVTWNNQPETTNALKVKVPESLEDVQHFINMDLTEVAQAWVDKPGENHGLLFQLLSDEYYRCLIFASSDHSDSTLHPRLEVTYAEPFEFDGFLTLRPGSDDGEDAFLHSRLIYNNYGEHPDFSSMSGTNSGVPYNVRNLITFDLTDLPEKAVVRYAGLSLYSYNSPANGPHRTLGGSNESVLLPVTSQWDEQTVTWDNQPNISDIIEVFLPESQSTFENYLNIDVSSFIRVMADHESYVIYGMILKLVEEEILYRNMIFASSDNPDTTLHPKLVVCYSIKTFESEPEPGRQFSLWPNPAKDIIHFTTALEGKTEVLLFDLNGRLVRSTFIEGKQHSFDVSGLESGLYTLQLKSPQILLNEKVLIQ